MVNLLLAVVFALASAGVVSAQCANGQCAVPQRFAPSARVIQVGPPAYVVPQYSQPYAVPQYYSLPTYQGSCANGQCGVQGGYSYTPGARYYYRAVPRARYYYYVR